MNQKKQAEETVGQAEEQALKPAGEVPEQVRDPLAELLSQAQNAYTAYMQAQNLSEREVSLLRTCILFVQTANAVLKYADAHLYRKARLSIIKLIVLQVLASNNGGVMPSKLSEWTQTEPQNITALINRMKRDGIVITERNSSDKRSVNVTLTDKGREVLSQAIPVAREIVDHVMSSISEGDAVVLKKLLSVLRQNASDGLEYCRDKKGVEGI